MNHNYSQAAKSCSIVPAENLPRESTETIRQEDHQEWEDDEEEDHQEWEDDKGEDDQEGEQ